MRHHGDALRPATGHAVEAEDGEEQVLVGVCRIVLGGAAARLPVGGEESAEGGEVGPSFGVGGEGVGGAAGEDQEGGWGGEGEGVTGEDVVGEC